MNQLTNTNFEIFFLLNLNSEVCLLNILIDENELIYLSSRNQNKEYRILKYIQNI